MQAVFGLRNYSETDEVRDRRIRIFTAVVLAGHGAQTEFVWPGYGRSTDTPQMDFSNEGYRESGFQGNLLAPTSHFAPLEMAYYFRTVRM